MRPVIGLLALLLLATPVSAAAPTLQERLQQRLSHVDSSDPTLEELRGYGPGVEAALQQLAQNQSLIFGIRKRAIAALGLLGGPVAQTTLEGLLDDPKTPADLLTSAGPAYLRGFRATQASGVLKRFQTLLKHEDWLVRQTAGQALAAWDYLPAVDLLRKHAAAEQHPSVKRALDRAITNHTAPNRPTR